MKQSLIAVSTKGQLTMPRRFLRLKGSAKTLALPSKGIRSNPLVQTLQTSSSLSGSAVVGDLARTARIRARESRLAVLDTRMSLRSQSSISLPHILHQKPHSLRLPPIMSCILGLPVLLNVPSSKALLLRVPLDSIHRSIRPCRSLNG